MAHQVFLTDPENLGTMGSLSSRVMYSTPHLSGRSPSRMLQLDIEPEHSHERGALGDALGSDPRVLAVMEQWLMLVILGHGLRRLWTLAA